MRRKVQEVWFYSSSGSGRKSGSSVNLDYPRISELLSTLFSLDGRKERMRVLIITPHDLLASKRVRQ